MYRGRLAPSPTGYLHLGHARTFAIAHQRARSAGGKIILRNDDLDRSRVRPEYVAAMIEDLHWLGLHWDEGPDIGGPFAPYSQSERLDLYRRSFQTLLEKELIYPCTCSRQDVLRAIQAPNQGDEEPIYPGTCREKRSIDAKAGRVNWRFRVPPHTIVQFHDRACGSQTFIAGRDFGDFVVWRNDDLPSYQLACTVDDALMQMTEVVRGADLLLSTARQLLLYQALGSRPPNFYHAPLVTDANGIRLAKRHDSLSLRTLRQQGVTPAAILQNDLRGLPRIWDSPGLTGGEHDRV